MFLAVIYFHTAMGDFNLVGHELVMGWDSNERKFSRKNHLYLPEFPF